MENSMKGRCKRKPKEPKELLMYFPEDYSAMKVSKNKIVGTAQQLSGLKENIWVDVDIGDTKPWKGFVIKTGQSLNELGRCEIAFLAFLNQHSSDKENIPLNDFFLQQKDSESDDEEFFCEAESETLKPKEKETKTKKIATKRPRNPDDPAAIQNKKEKKLKREQILAQSMSSKKQSRDIFKQLENMIQINENDKSDDDVPSDCGRKVVVLDHPERPTDQTALESGNFLNKLQEMFATSMKNIHERFDSVDRAVSLLGEQQKATKKTLEEFMAAIKVSGKSKVSRPLNLVVNHSPMNHSPISNGAMLTRQLQETPEGQNQNELSPGQSTPVPADKEGTGYIGHRKFGVTVTPIIIKRAEENARGVPKALAFGLLNILVDVQTQADSNISGQNGKKPLEKNIMSAIQSHLATYFNWTEEEMYSNWKKEPMNIQQRIADKCRNLNKQKKK